MARGRDIGGTKTVAALLKELRRNAKIRQIDLAAKLRVPQSFISKYEAGERRLDIIEIDRICRALGVTLTEFVRQLKLKLKGANDETA